MWIKPTINTNLVLLQLQRKNAEPKIDKIHVLRILKKEKELNIRKSREVFDEKYQQGILSVNQVMILNGSFINDIAKFANAAQQMQHGHKQLNTVLPI